MAATLPAVRGAAGGSAGVVGGRRYSFPGRWLVDPLMMVAASTCLSFGWLGTYPVALVGWVGAEIGERIDVPGGAVLSVLGLLATVIVAGCLRDKSADQLEMILCAMIPLLMVAGMTGLAGDLWGAGLPELRDGAMDLGNFLFR